MSNAKKNPISDVKVSYKMEDVNILADIALYSLMAINVLLSLTLVTLVTLWIIQL